MEPTASDLQLVPGATKDLLAADAMCCRAALSTVVATSIVLVILGVLVGEWPGLAWVHTPGDWQKDAQESLRGVPEQRVERTGPGGHQERGRGPGTGCCP